MLRRLLLAATVLAAVAASPAWAVQPDEILPDPALEARARALSSELRCLVCQNQSIDDSAAPLARDLRLVVRERLKAGDSDAAVKIYLTSRYGDFVLLKPPLKTETVLLWATPVAVLLTGAVFLLTGRRRRSSGAVPPLSAAEQAKLDALIGKS